MESVFKLLSNKLSSNYRCIYGKSEIRISYDILPYERVDINDFVNDVKDALKGSEYSYEIKVIRMFSEYPSFLIYKDKENIGIVILNYGLKI
jgi:hypothetical protein